MIDPLSTHGLAVRGDRLYRVMGSLNGGGAASDLLVYDRSARDGHVLISSPMENAVYAIRDDGAKSTLWQGAAPKDACHLNCLIDVEGALYATAFGMFDERRGWSRDLRARTGALVRLPSEEIVLRGLSQPHSRRYMDGIWLVCNSALNELAAYDAQGTMLQSHRFAGYTREIAFDDRYIYVGESSSRQMNHGCARESRITILDRSHWSIVASYEVGVGEIYDVSLVPKALVEGARIGFRTNATRVEQQDQWAMFLSVGLTPQRLWALGEPLPPASLQANVDGQIPAAAVVDEISFMSERKALSWQNEISVITFARIG